MMKTSDNRIAGWIKSARAIPAEEQSRAKFRNAFPPLRRGVSTPRIVSLLEATHEMLEAPAETPLRENWWQLIKDYKEAGYPKTASALVAIGIPILVKMPMERVMEFLPDAKTLEKWRKKAACSVEQLSAFCLTDLTVAAKGAGIAWLLVHVKPDKLAPLFSFLLDRCEAGAETTMAVSLLRGYLLKDPKGRRLAGVLACTVEHPKRLTALADVVRSTQDCLLAACGTLALVAQPKAKPLPLAEFVRHLFRDIHGSEGKNRRKACGAVARLGSSFLLAGNLSASGADALKIVAEIGEELRNLSRDPATAKNTWALTDLGMEKEAEGAFITPEGARRWAFAFEEATKAGQNTARLEALGHNLGLRPLAEVGQALSFNPGLHEDSEGGILPDEPVVAITTGWALDQKSVVRARVRRQPTR